jgi:hypothetical protein
MGKGVYGKRQEMLGQIRVRPSSFGRESSFSWAVPEYCP